MENELIRKYELMAIVDARLNDEEKETIFKEIADAITKGGGKIINAQVWLEKQKLAFDIKKCKEGTYYLTNYEADGTVNKKVKSILKLNERVLRFTISKVEKSFAETVKS